MKQGGSGGANTNLHGLAFEKETDFARSIEANLNNVYKLVPHVFQEPSKLPIPKCKDFIYDVYRRSDNELIGIVTKQNQFYNVLKEQYGLNNANKKRWKPDEVFFNFKTNTIFIVEKKNQQSSGSVDEKIFGFVNKRRLYQNNFNQIDKEPKPTVEFSVLFNSDWWLEGKNGANNKNYQDYFDNLRIDGIKIFFDDYEFWWFGL